MGLSICPCPSMTTSCAEADTAPAFKAQHTPYLTLIPDWILMSWPSFDSFSLVCPETWISPFHEADSSQLCRKTAAHIASSSFDRFAMQGYHPCQGSLVIDPENSHLPLPKETARLDRTQVVSSTIPTIWTRKPEGNSSKWKNGAVGFGGHRSCLLQQPGSLGSFYFCFLSLRDLQFTVNCGRGRLSHPKLVGSDR